MGYMLRIAICDDDKCCREMIKEALLRFTNKRDIEIKTDEYPEGSKLISSAIKYDLIIMDYMFEDEDEDAIEYSRRIREYSETVPIVFCSSYSEAVFKTFEVNAFRFLKKPINYEEFGEMMDAFVKRIQMKEYLIVKSDKEWIPIRLDDIVYLEAKGKRTAFCIKGQKDMVECFGVMASYEDKLPGDRFFRCQKSFIVNLDYISSYTFSDITLNNSTAIRLGRGKYVEFLTLYEKHIFN